MNQNLATGSPKLKSAKRESLATSRKPVLLIISLLIFGLLSACSTKGDFGRDNTGPTQKYIAGKLNFAAANARDEPVSSFPLTEEEKIFRDLAADIQSSPAITGFLSESYPSLRRWGLMPERKDGTTFAVEVYHQMLLDQDNTPLAQYNQIIEDLRGDYERVCVFSHQSKAVQRVDKLRLATFERDWNGEPKEEANMWGRIAENEAISQRTFRAFRQRAKAYRYALKRLGIRTPDNRQLSILRLTDALEGHATSPKCRSTRSKGPRVVRAIRAQ